MLASIIHFYDHGIGPSGLRNAQENIRIYCLKFISKGLVSLILLCTSLLFLGNYRYFACFLVDILL